MIEGDEGEQRGRGELLTNAGGRVCHVGAPTAQPSGHTPSLAALPMRTQQAMGHCLDVFLAVVA
jgi:hypothetical protein